MEDLTIDDVRLDESQARVTVNEVPDTPGLAANVFEGVAAGGIFVDSIDLEIEILESFLAEKHVSGRDKVMYQNALRVYGPGSSSRV